MGYSVSSVRWPNKEQMQTYIQDPSTTVFYELAHGTYSRFANECRDGSYYYTTPEEVRGWMASRQKMTFAFIGSCFGMCETGVNTFSYELRKGSTDNTVTVGYCEMSEKHCEECWDYSLAWQKALFDRAADGNTVKASFDEAMAEYLPCAINECMRFVGDENLIITEPDAHTTTTTTSVSTTTTSSTSTTSTSMSITTSIPSTNRTTSSTTTTTRVNSSTTTSVSITTTTVSVTTTTTVANVKSENKDSDSGDTNCFISTSAGE
jgi:hypothetical protein